MNSKGRVEVCEARIAVLMLLRPEIKKGLSDLRERESRDAVNF